MLLTEVELKTFEVRVMYLLLFIAWYIPTAPLIFMTAPHYTVFTKEILVSLFLSFSGFVLRSRYRDNSIMMALPFLCQIPSYLFSAYLILTKEDILNCFTQSGDGGITRFFARDVTYNQEKQEPLQTHTDNIGVLSQPQVGPQ